MKFEKQFFILSFFIISSLLLSLILVINFDEYKKEKEFLLDNIKKSFQICSYKLNCKDISIDFEKKSNQTPFTLEETKNSFYMLFDLPKFKKYYLKLSMPKDVYYEKLKEIKINILKKLIAETFIILVISMIFTYILYLPLKKAYKINEEFIKDILHDLNTPLTALKLNLFMLKKEIGEHKRIKKIEQSINTILNYQQNLKNFLSNNPSQIETFDIKEIIDERIKFYLANYPTIKATNKAKYKLTTNKNAFFSIIDNLLSNAFKYNKKDGKVEVYLEGKTLIIKDSGIGIKNPKKVFERFYKETQRGTGIGMNIVKKLCDELNIDIKISSDKTGTTIYLDLSKINTS